MFQTVVGKSVKKHMCFYSPLFFKWHLLELLSCPNRSNLCCAEPSVSGNKDLPWCGFKLSAELVWFPFAATHISELLLNLSLLSNWPKLRLSVVLLSLKTLRCIRSSDGWRADSVFNNAVRAARLYCLYVFTSYWCLGNTSLFANTVTIIIFIFCILIVKL